MLNAVQRNTGFSNDIKNHDRDFSKQFKIILLNSNHFPVLKTSNSNCGVAPQKRVFYAVSACAKLASLMDTQHEDRSVSDVHLDHKHSFSPF